MNLWKEEKREVRSREIAFKGREARKRENRERKSNLEKELIGVYNVLVIPSCQAF